MFKVVPLERKHLEQIVGESINSKLKAGFDDAYIKKVLAKEESRAGFVGDDLVICGGITHIWPGRGHAWMILSENIKKYPLIFFRAMKRLLTDSEYNRVEVDQPVGFTHGHRRFILMGFKQEIYLARHYYPNGSDASVYSWTRD